MLPPKISLIEIPFPTILKTTVSEIHGFDYSISLFRIITKYQMLEQPTDFNKCFSNIDLI
eukprot:UN21781